MYHQSVKAPMAFCEPRSMLDAGPSPHLIFSARASPTRGPVSASAIRCPIMMLTRQANLPTKSKPPAEDIRCQNKPENCEFSSVLRQGHFSCREQPAQMDGAIFKHKSRILHHSGQKAPKSDACHVSHDDSRAGLSWTPPQGPVSHVPHQHPETARQCRHNVNFRKAEKDRIKLLLRPGHVIQICGPPMVGKSTVVRHALDEFINSHQCYHLEQHHIICKAVLSFQDFLMTVARRLCPHHLHDPNLNAEDVLQIIRSVLEPGHQCHHVLIFHKCENLLEDSSCHVFLDFLARLIDELPMIPITTIFTSYKQFPVDPVDQFVQTIEIGMLSDIMDVVSLLHHYISDSEVLNYAHVFFLRSLCFPEAIRLAAKQFLIDEKCRVSPDVLEKKLKNDQRFLSRLFESRLQEVENWIPTNILFLLTHFSHSVENSFTEAHLEYVNSSDQDPVDLKIFIRYLKQNYVVWSLPVVNRLVIHPLVVYYSMTMLHREKKLMLEKWFDSTCNRFTHFLGRVLMSAEAGLQHRGRKALVYSSLLQEGPNLRYMIQMAITCNNNTYKHFLKIAVSAAGFIIKCFSKEASSFYWGLYKNAQEHGTECELALMELLLGQAIADGSGKEWKVADGYLTSAIKHLSRYGNSFFLGQALNRKAINLHRQGRYEEALVNFERARKVLRNVNRHALGEAFYVSETKVDEEIITQEIHETIPYIFTGKNQLARTRLARLLDLIKGTFESHPELATLLNLMGLTEQRGNKDLENAVRWYIQSYKERLYLAKMCPETLLVVLNNIGVIMFNLGRAEECMKYLNQALDIRRECGWVHYYTGLTLVHLAEINMKIGKFAEALKNALEAERIFAATVQDHDMRLRANIVLAHVRLALRQALDSEDQAAELSRQGYCVQPECSPRNVARGCSVVNERLGDYNIPFLSRLEETESERSSDSLDSVSVKSCELFGAGSVSSKKEPNLWNSADQWGQFSSQHPNNNQASSPLGPGILCATITEIEPCDLQMSAEDYIDRLLSIASKLKGTLSDDGYSVKLCAHEHAMLLNWGNSREKFEEHRNMLLQFSHDHPWIEEIVSDNEAEIESKYRSLAKHKPIFLYIMNTSYENLQLSEFIRHLQKACSVCQFSKNVFTEGVWQTEAEHCMQERKKKQRRMQMLDALRLNPLPAGSNSSACPTFLEEARTAFGEDDVFQSNNNLACALDSLHMGLPSRNFSPLRDSDSVMDIAYTCNNMSSQQAPSTRNFVDLLSGSSAENQSMPGHHEHMDRYARISNTFHDHVEQKNTTHHIQQKTMSSSNSSDFVMPRIANDQRVIFDKIKSCRTNSSSSQSPSVERGHILMDASAKWRKSSGGTDMTSLACPSILREPVEQSYNGDEDPSWHSPDSHLSLVYTGSQSGARNEMPVFDEVYQQTCCASVREFSVCEQNTQRNNEQLGIEMDYVSEHSHNDDLVKSFLVLQECRTGRMSHEESSYRSYPVCDLDTPGKTDLNSILDTQPASSPAKHESRSEKVLVSDYIETNCPSIIKTEESELRSDKSLGSDWEEGWLNLANYVLDIPQLPSEKHHFSSISGTNVSDSNVGICPNGTPELFHAYESPHLPSQTHMHSVETYVQNDSHFSLPHYGQDVHESARELKVSPQEPQEIKPRKPTEDSESTFDSGLNSLPNVRASDDENHDRRYSGSESSDISARSRSESVSSSSSSTCHVNEVAHMPESGYLSHQQVAGTRPKTSSTRNRRHQRAALVNNRSAGGRSTSADHNQGISEIQFNVTNFSQTSSNTHDSREGQHFSHPARLSQDDQQRLENFQKRRPVHTDSTSSAQAVETFNDLKSGTSATKNQNNFTNESTEQSWTETLKPGETRSEQEGNHLIETDDRIRPELLCLNARASQGQVMSSEHSEVEKLLSSLNLSSK